MEITIIPVLNDNYAYLLEAEDITAILDPGEAGPVIHTLEEKNLRLDYILNTHHHYDHTDGNMEIKQKYGAQIVGPAKDAHRIAGMDIELSEGDEFSLGGENAQIFETPGHTLGGICFYFPESKAAFTGDTLFSMGCGRLFEGTPAQMWDSLQKIMALPDDTNIYCGHEYTRDGAAFCLTIEPDNEDLKQRMKEVNALRANGKPTIPVTLSIEKKTSAFLRAGSGERFAEIRELRNNF